MKITFNGSYILLLSVSMISSCQKDKSNKLIKLSTTVNVINAVVNNTGIKVNTNNAPILYTKATQIAYGSAALYYLPRTAGNITVVATADTTTYLLNTSLTTNSGITTVYIAGQTGAVDTLVREETNYIYIHNDVSSIDSSISIRFVNLSPNSNPVSFNIKNNTAAEASNLAYKGITDFKKYPALAANASYIFEIRDAGTNTLLTTYTLSTGTGRFHSVAVIVKGLAGTTTGANAFGAFTANYF